MWLILVLLTGSALDASPPLRDGVIEGVVVHAADHTPVPRAEVVLRAKVDGQLLPVAETTADAQGRFRFAQLPADGADRLSAGRQSRRHSLSRPERAAEFPAATGGSDAGRSRRRHVSQSAGGAPTHDHALPRAGRSAGDRVDAHRQSQYGVLRRPSRRRGRRAGDAATGHPRRLRSRSPSPANSLGGGSR